MNTRFTYRSRVKPGKMRTLILKGVLSKRDCEAILRLFGVIGNGFIPSQVGIRNLFEGPSTGSTIYSERKILSNVIHEVIELEETEETASVNLGISELRRRLSRI